MSGAGLGNTRVVDVGEVLELRLPTGPRGERAWRVSSYDSAFLVLADRPERVRTEGAGSVILRARAKRAGETDIEVTEVAPADGSPETVRFTVRILQ